jgi:hypothetical protein
VRVTLGQTLISVLHPTVPNGFGVRIVFPLSIAANGARLEMPVYVDASGFVIGPAAVTLTSLSFSRPVATEEHLLSVLYGRAKS